MNPQEKQAWCEIGAKAEARLVSPVRDGCVLLPNPAKAHDKYAHDLLMLLPADLKTVRTRFNTAERYGIPARSAITLNRKDVERYASMYPNLVVVFDVDFGDYKRIGFASIRAIQTWIKCGKAPEHAYLHRVDDTQGNAKSSYILDAEWLVELGAEQ